MSGAQIAIILAAVFTGALIKSVTGMGLPLVALPVIALATSVETAVAVLAIPNTAHNLALAVRHRDHRHETRHLGRFCAAGIVGAAIGTWSLGVVPDGVLMTALLVIVAGYLVNRTRDPSMIIGDAAGRRWSAPIGGLAGLFQGATGISGPIVGIWHHGLRLNRNAFVLSISWVFLITGATQTVLLAIRGSLGGRIGVSLALLVIVILTIPFGEQLRVGLSGRTFDRLVIGLISLSCLSVAVDLITRAL